MKFIKKNLLIILILCATSLLLIYAGTSRKTSVGEKKIKQKSLSVVENDVVILTLTFPRGGDIFSFGSLQKIYALNKMLGKMEGIRNISSLVGATVVSAEKDEILVKPFVPLQLFQVKDEKKIRALRKDYPLYPELAPYISKDLQSCSFYIEPGMKYSSYKLFDRLIQIQKDFKGQYGFSFEFTGFRPVKVIIEKFLTQDILYFLPIVLIFMLLIFYLNFSNIRIIILSFFVLVLSSVSAYSVVMALNFKLTPLIVLIPAFNAGLLTDYLLHFFYHTKGLSTAEEIRSRRNKLVVPLLLTALSTVIGFLSMMMLSSEGHKFLGLFTAVSIILTYLATIFWLPGVMTQIAPAAHSIDFKNKTRLFEKTGGLLFSIFYFFSRYKKIVYASSAVFVLVSLFFIPRIIIQPYPVYQIPKDSTVRKAEKILNSQFAGTIPFSLQFDTNADQSLLKRKNLLHIEKIHDRLSRDPDIGYDYSFITIIKRINYYFHNSAAEYERIPALNDEFQFQSLIEQYLIFYSTTASPQEYESLMDPAYRLFSINGVLKYSGNDSLRKFLKTESAIEAGLPAGWKLTVRGPLSHLIKQSASLRNNWIFSFMTSLILIFLTVWIYYRDLKLSLISLFPSLLSVIITTGFIALFNIEIDIYTIIFIAITMGLSIDYTIHVISAVNELKKRPEMKGLSIDDRESVQTYLSFIMNYSGVPVFLSFLTSIVSFGVLLFSSFEGARNFGLIISLSLIISLVISLLVLPALLLKRTQGE